MVPAINRLSILVGAIPGGYPYLREGLNGQSIIYCWSL